MDDAAIRRQQKCSRIEAVENIGQCGRFGGLRLDHLADEVGPANVRNDERESLATLFVDGSVARASTDGDPGNADRGLLQH